MANEVKVLQKQKVKIIWWAGWISKEKGLPWSNFEYKTKSWYKGSIFINEADDSTIALCKSLDLKMGDEITLVTSVEL